MWHRDAENPHNALGRWGPPSGWASSAHLLRAIRARQGQAGTTPGGRQAEPGCQQLHGGGLAAGLPPAAVLNSPESLPGKEGREAALSLVPQFPHLYGWGEGRPSKLCCTFRARYVSPSKVLRLPARLTCLVPWPLPLWRLTLRTRSLLWPWAFQAGLPWGPPRLLLLSPPHQWQGTGARPMAAQGSPRGCVWTLLLEGPCAASLSGRHCWLLSRGRPWQTNHQRRKAALCGTRTIVSGKT